ncbi:MAG: cell division protein FtsW [Marinoscillum sp.]|jgi:cell division protein FtsW
MTANVSTNVSQETPMPVLSWWQSLMIKGDFSQLMAVNMNALVWSWLGLMALGWVMVMSASTSIAETYTGNAAYFSIRHGVYIVLGIVVAFLVSRISLAWWQKTDWLWLFLGGLGLVAVLIPGIGHEVNGSARWLNLGLLKVQPSEIVKLTAVLYISGYLIRRQVEVQNQWSGFIKPLVILGVIIVLLLLEPDFGSVVVLMGAVLVLLFLGGVKAGQFFLLVVATLILGYLVVTAEEYRLARLTTYWQPFHPDNVYGSGYQLAQALIAFGRGELWGTGLGESVQKLFYLPEAHTDFVFAIWSEETGLVGGLFALSLLTFFLAQCMKIGWQAQKMGNLYGAFICFGIATLFGLQIVINLGVNTGLLPTKGLTLPFFSYGGSSLIICCVMVALVYRVSVEVDAAVANEKTKTIKKVTRKTKNNSVSAVFADKQINSDGMNEYVTGFDAYVEELNGGRNDK